MDLYRCTDCGFVFLHPLPSLEDMQARYHDAYQGATAVYFTKVEAKMRRSRRRMGQLARCLPADRRKRFLDVGCNGGFMVEAARERGFEAWGVDLDPALIDYARAHYPDNRYLAGPVEEIDASHGPFDAVYCAEVIEHVADANGFVAAIASLTEPGAALYLTTPDIGHWRRPRDLLEWDAFTPPAHCLYFSPNNLALLLRRHGFEIFKRRLAWKPGIKVLARRVASGA